jgi:hypothetical protein
VTFQSGTDSSRCAASGSAVILAITSSALSDPPAAGVLPLGRRRLILPGLAAARGPSKLADRHIPTSGPLREGRLVLFARLGVICGDLGCGAERATSSDWQVLARIFWAAPWAALFCYAAPHGARCDHAGRRSRARCGDDRNPLRAVRSHRAPQRRPAASGAWPWCCYGACHARPGGGLPE